MLQQGLEEVQNPDGIVFATFVQGVDEQPDRTSLGDLRKTRLEEKPQLTLVPMPAFPRFAVLLGICLELFDEIPEGGWRLAKGLMK
jgi:hypothetical protein